MFSRKFKYAPAHRCTTAALLAEARKSMAPRQPGETVFEFSNREMLAMQEASRLALQSAAKDATTELPKAA